MAIDAIKSGPDDASKLTLEPSGRALAAELRQAAYDHRAAMQDLHGTSRVPDAPFKTTWHELALKRVVRWAAENGYDRITWTTGAQQADRYDLSKHLSHLDWSNIILPEGDRVTLNGWQREGRDILPLGTHAIADLPGVVGKDIAAKIQAQIADKAMHGTIEGPDLSVGGEGMKGFYDKILVDAANKLGRKYGARVEPSTVSTKKVPELDVRRAPNGNYWIAATEGKVVTSVGTLPADTPAPEIKATLDRMREAMRGTEPVHSLPITPELKAMALGGQPLFQKQSKYEVLNNAPPHVRDAYQFADSVASGNGLRADTVPEQLRLGGEAFRSLVHYRDRVGKGVSVLADRLTADFKEKGAVSLVGHTVEKPVDLAAVAQVLRDPRWETFRAFLIKGGKIVQHFALTSRQPGSVTFGDAESSIASRIRDGMKAVGADGYYIMHNHPAGRAKASPQDRQLTSMIASTAPGFLGHVIIDHNEYGVLDGGGYGTIHKKAFGGYDPNKNPVLAHALLNETVTSTADLVRVGEMLQKTPGMMTVVATGPRGSIQAIAEYPYDLILGPKTQDPRKPYWPGIARLHRLMQMSGAGGYALAVVSDLDVNPRRFGVLVHNGLIRDAVSPLGTSVLHSVGAPAAEGFRSRARTYELHSFNQVAQPP